MIIQNLKFNRIQFWILSFSLILGLSFLLNSYSVGAEDFSDNIEKAISIYENGDFKKAIQELKQVISVLKDRADFS